jgi:hypothetical protein
MTFDVRASKSIILGEYSLPRRVESFMASSTPIPTHPPKIYSLTTFIVVPANSILLLLKEGFDLAFLLELKSWLLIRKRDTTELFAFSQS